MGQILNLQLQNLTLDLFIVRRLGRADLLDVHGQIPPFKMCVLWPAPQEIKLALDTGGAAPPGVSEDLITVGHSGDGVGHPAPRRTA